MTGGVISEGGTEISGVLKDPAGDIPVTVVDNGDGTYTCSYVPRTSGPIPLEVNMKTNAFGEGMERNQLHLYSVALLTMTDNLARTNRWSPFYTSHLCLRC